MAIVAGSNLVLDPTITRVFEQMNLVRAERRDGRPTCKAFCDSADGYVRQEAVVVMVLSSKKELQAEGISCAAEILGHKSLTGSGTSVTTPCPHAQEALYRDVAVMAATRVSEGCTVQYVECHGTGTKVGDETEAAVLTSVVKSPELVIYSKTALPLPIGSMKSNVGHTESASGLTALVKVLLSLERGILPPNLHYAIDRRNRNCGGLDDGTLRIVTEQESIDTTSIAVVNSFGFGGTYVQVMVKGTPAADRCEIVKTFTDDTEPWMNINPVVGRTVATAYTISKAVAAEKFCFAVGPPDVHEGDFSVRSFTTPEKRTIYTEAVNLNVSRPVWLVFAGHGGVWPGMGYELYRQSHVYMDVFARCSEHLSEKWQCDSLRRLLAWQQTNDMLGESKEYPFKDIVDATVCLVAVQIGLVNVLETAGFTRETCDGYVGHSAGEIVAGYFDGCYSLEMTLDIAVLRGRAAADVAAQHPGAMFTVQGLSREDVEDVIERTKNSVDVACHTGQHQVTLSGLESDLMVIKTELEGSHPSARVRKINTFGVAFHSKLISTTTLAKLETDLRAVFGEDCRKLRSGKWRSTCYEPGDPAGADVGAAYHCRALRSCVEFERACKNIPNNGLIIECGPGAMFRSVFESDDQPNGYARHLPLLRCNESAVETLATAYGHLYLQAVPLSDRTDKRRTPREVFSSPTQRSTREAFLAWDHSREFSMFLQPHRHIGPGGLASTQSVTFDFDFCGKDRWLLQHWVGGRCLLPAAVYLCAIWEGVRLNPDQECIVEDFQIHQPVDMSQLPKLQLVLEFCNTTTASGGLISVNPTGGCEHAVVHCSGVLVASCMVTVRDAATFQAAEVPPSSYDGDSVDIESLYHQLGRHGYSYGKDFRVISAISPDKLSARIHPVRPSQLDVHFESKACTLALDGMLQHIIAHKIGDSQYGACQLPVRIKHVRLSAHLVGSICDERGFDVRCLQETSAMFCTSEATICGVEVIQPSTLFPSESTQLVSVGKIDLVPDLTRPCQIGEPSQNYAEVHYLPDDVDFSAWKPRVLESQRFHGESSNCGKFGILVSKAPGFAAFVRSLQKEPGYNNVRGIHVLIVAAKHSDTQIPDHVVHRAQLIFSKNDDTLCLFLGGRTDTGLDDLVLMSEETQQPFDTKNPNFPCPYGCFLALSSGQPERFDCWTATSSPLLASISKHTEVPTHNVEVAFASLNFRDALVGIGKLPRSDAITGYSREGSGFGLDFAGYVVSAQDSRLETLTRKKVIGLGRDCIADMLQDQPCHLCWELGDDDDLEAFATVPCAYATAYYALCVRGGLQENSRVLVHCAAGGVGQAALHLCKRRLADPASQLFVTCGNATKRNFLHESCGIPMENIGDSRSRSFAILIRNRTRGEGVHLVLNSLTGEQMEASIECLSFGGQLLELGKGTLDPSVMENLRRNDKQLSMIDLDQVMNCSSAFEPLRQMIEIGLRNGEVIPITRKVFSVPHETKDAFEFMSAGDHIGKVLLKIGSGSLHARVPNIAAMLPNSIPSKKQVIVVVGGLGGLGLCLAELFAKRFRSACKILLCSRSGATRHEQQRAVEDLRVRHMAAVDVRIGDCSQRETVDDLLASLGGGDELWAVVNAAATTRDCTFDRMDVSDWLEPFAAKVAITNNFSDAVDDFRFAEVCAGLKHFVCISSVVAAVGNVGQTNYACANAAMEQAVMNRVANGKAGLCVRLGFLPHVGLTTHTVVDYAHLRSLSIDCALRELERLMASTTQGLYAVYGRNDSEGEYSASIRTVYDTDQMARRIFKVVRNHVQGSISGDAIVNTRIVDLPLDSLAVVLLSNELREVTNTTLTNKKILKLSPWELSHLLSPSEPPQLAAGICPSADCTPATNDHIVVIATIGGSSKRAERMKLDDVVLQSLTSIREQTRSPDVIFIIFEDRRDFGEEALMEQVHSVLPGAKIGHNERTGAADGLRGSSLGSLNTGIMKSCNETTLDDTCWIAPLDTATTRWLPDHLDHCVMAASARCQFVTSTMSGARTRMSVPCVGDEFFASSVKKSVMLVRRALLMEAGLFDEAMGGMADADLYVRLCDVVADEQRQLRLQRQAVTVACTAELVAPRTPCVPSHCNSGGSEEDDVQLFLYKHASRMTPEELDNVMCLTGYESANSALVSHPADFPECQPVALEMWNGDMVSVRRDTFDALREPVDASVHDSTPLTCSMPLKRMLVGVITCDADRVRGLVSDLGCMLDDAAHCVVVFANERGSSVGNRVSRMLKAHKFRGHVIRGTDRIVLEVCHEFHGSADATCFPLPITEARTVIQTFLLATAKAEEFDVMAVVDDDMRLPKTWGVRNGDEVVGDILLSRAVKTPPNPTAMSMRTQLLDFLFALDSQHPNSHAPPCNGSKCPADQVYSTLQDQYYDLSSSRWDHLEIPRRFQCAVAGAAFVEECWHRILVGDPLAREAVSVEDGQSLQRGGCMVLYRKSFSLLQTAQEAPSVQLASGRQAASRRSDSLWVQRHFKSNAKRSVVRRHLAVLHDNMHDSIPSPERMRETVALEMVGAIVCRPIEEREVFARCRVNALRCSIARIRGICKTLRGRPYFVTVHELSSFVESLEEMFSDDLWRKDVYDVVDEHVRKLKSWEAHQQPEREVAKEYALDHNERAFLSHGHPDAREVADVFGLRVGPLLPIPCLHRIHKDGEVLCGAHKVQESIGMSLPLSKVERRLRQLAQLSDVTASRALVTIDDGFRDVLLLKDIFRNLSKSLQPVLFVPSALLRDDDGMMLRKRHLPLTCLYDYCASRGIDPDDESVLGDASRSTLKAVPEKTQYERLADKSIPIDIGTSDLLSIADLHALVAEGWWVGTHGPDHSDLTTAASFETIAATLKEDCVLIRRRGWTPWFAWPEGSWCARVADAVALLGGGPTAQFGLSTPPLGEGPHPAVVNRVIWNGRPERRKCVLVTGGDGFLGRHLCLLLQGYGFDVFNYDITSGCDILNRETLLAELRDNNISACVHLAAVADLYEAEADPTNARRINIDGTRVVLSCCDDCGVRLLFASTCCVYGNNGVVGSSNEQSPVAPTEIYAMTKLDGEKIVLNSARFCDLRHVVLRLATFYGPGMRDSLATAQFLKAACEGTAIRVHGSGDQTRCFTHVHDIADGIRVVLQTTNFSGVVNVADDRECSVNELAAIAMKAARATVEIQHVKDRDGQIKRSMISNDRLRALGNRGWKPTVALEDGLRGCATMLQLNISSPPTRSPSCRSGPKHEPLTVPDRVRPSAWNLDRTKLPIHPGCHGDVYVSETLPNGTQLVAYVAGNLRSCGEVAVRIHSECLFGDVFGSLKCDCGLQFRDFVESIGDNSPGILVYVKGHEGRGAGLSKKTRAYNDLDQHPWKHHNQALLDAGAEKVDARSYDDAADLVVRLIVESAVVDCGFANEEGMSSARRLPLETVLIIHTNNDEKVDALNRAISRCQAQSRFRCQQLKIEAGQHCTLLNVKYLVEKERDNGQLGLRVADWTDPAELSLHQNVDDLPGITTRINSTIFDATDVGLFDFVREHGFVVVRGLVSPDQIKEANAHLDRMMTDQFEDVCRRVGHDQLTFEEFASGVSQFRDVFLTADQECNIFKQLTCDNGPSSLSKMAQYTMAAVDPSGDWNGIKLLHDHIITKPSGHASKKIPLHQDSMFWPVDIPACSTWTLLTDAPLGGGCMEVRNCHFSCLQAVYSCF